MKSLLFLMVVVLMLSCGTDQNPPRIENFTIINNSNYSVDIVPYSAPNGTEILSSKLTLVLGFIYKRQFKSYAPSYEMSFFETTISNNLFPLQKVDIVFNNLKKTTYFSCDDGVCSEPRNIFNNSDDFLLDEVYIITNEDYENATNCGGNCN